MAMRRPRGTIQFLLASLILPLSLGAQEGQDDLLQAAQRAESRGDMAAALDHLHQLTEERPTFAFGHFVLGRVYLGVGEWEKARRALERAVELDPDWPIAHNYLGLAFMQDPLMWDQAIAAFQEAIALDPDYPEALYNLASISYLSGGPKGLGAAHQLYHHLLTVVPDFRDARERLAEVEAKLLSLTSGLVVPSRKERERSGGTVGDPMEGYRAMVSPFTGEEDPEKLWLDIREIATDEERKQWKPASVEQRGEFFLRFWNRRDPLPTTPENERLEEHYRRLEYARTHFRSRRPQGYDERGKIYVRHGEPEERVVYDLIASPTGFGSRRTESWMYRDEQGKRRIFHFSEMGVGNLVLVPSLVQAVNPLRAVPLLPTREQLRELGLTPQFFFARETLDPKYGRMGIMLDEIIRQPFPYGAESSFRAFEELVEEEALEVAEAQYWALHEESYEPPGGGDGVKLPFQSVQFAGEASGSEVVFVYGLPLDQFAPPDASEALVRSTLQVFDPNWELIEARETQSGYPVPRGKRMGVSLESLTLSPGPYHFAFGVEGEATETRGSYRGDLKVRPFHYQRLNLSDLLLAEIISPHLGAALLQRHGLGIQPLPFAMVSGDRPLHLYFEIYHLTADDEGRARYRMDFTIASYGQNHLAARIFSSLGHLLGQKEGSGRVTVSYQRESQVESWIQPEYVALDLGSLPPGVYTIQVEVSDQVGDVHVTQKTIFRVDESGAAE